MTAAGPGAPRPVGLYEVELSRPLPELAGPGRVEVLVRLHGRPLGTLTATIVGGGLPPAELAARVDQTLGDAVARHLAADGPDPTTCQPRPPSDAVTVVVTTIGPQPSTAALLRALTQQTHPAAAVLVVDNRPATSGTRQFVEALGLPTVRYVAEARRGLSRARNAGLAEARTSLVAFTDDDVVVDERWLEFLVSGFDEPRVGCVTGLILPAEMDTPAQLLFEQFGGFGKGFEQRRFDRDGPTPPGPAKRTDPLYPFAAGVFGSGANAAFRTDALRELGGFDVRLGAGTYARGGEDLDVHLSVVRAGHVLVYEPAALLRHAHHRDVAGLRRQVHGYGVGLGAMVTKRLACHPADRRDLARRLPAGLGYLLHPDSSKNASKAADYPRSLTAAELAGVLVGPAAFLASAWHERSRP